MTQSPVKRRGGSGLTLLHSINSNNSYLVGCGKTEDCYNEWENNTAVAQTKEEQPEILSENEAEDLAMPVHTESSNSSICEDENNDEEGNSLVPVIESPGGGLMIRPDSDD